MPITTRATAKKEPPIESPLNTPRAVQFETKIETPLLAPVQTRSAKRKAAEQLAEEETTPSKKPRKDAVSRDTKRKAAQDAAPEEATRSKKPRKSVDSPDEKFRKMAIEQFKALKVGSKKSTRAADVVDVIPFLEIMSQPRKKSSKGAKSGEVPDAYMLTSAEARRLFSSDTEILAPAFVTDGAKSVLDDDSKARPIEQVLNQWFVDSTEVHTCNDSKKPLGSDAPETTISKLRDHLLANSGYVEYPHNLPDIPNPLHQQCVPDHLQNINCNFLRDFARIALDVVPGNICPEGCSERSDSDQCCDKGGHELTFREYMEVLRWQAVWGGALMFADAGAVTFAHWDTFSLGTWISCYEGEVGFAWLSNPTDTERREAQKYSRGCFSGRWLYKVVRPGESMYMPPGTIHLVFRMPHGKQTLCMSGHTLRRSTDIDVWLKMLLLEAKNNLTHFKDLGLDEYIVMLPVLVKTIRSILDRHAKTEQEIARLGGKAKLQRARRSLKELEKKTKGLLKVARENQ